MRMTDEKDRAIYALSEFASWMQIFAVANSLDVVGSIGKNDHDTIAEKIKESSKMILECDIARVAMQENQRKHFMRLSQQTVSTLFGEDSTQ